MQRELTGHKINPANDKLRIVVADEPGPGGANHRYLIHGFQAYSHPAGDVLELRFQNGAINEAGINGLTHEALIAILIDRLSAFQRGKYACRENALALTKLEEAQMWLLARTRGRMDRGVEGTMAA